MSNELLKKLKAADEINPKIFRVFRSKRPGLYLANAKQIMWDRAVDLLKQRRSL